MPNTVLVGAQWGDEGKGKVIDVLAEDVDVIVRYQGGNNAGHTVTVGDDKSILHLLPSGILHAGKHCVIGNGMVVNPMALVEELSELESKGIDASGRLHISDRAHIVFPFHRALDATREASVSKAQQIGTTKRGIGPSYSDKVSRVGLRMGDLVDSAFPELLKPRLTEANTILEAMGAEPFDFDTLVKEYEEAGKYLSEYIADTIAYLDDAQRSGKSLLFEGAQGTLLDIDFGTFPYVTSSSATAGGACTGTGVPPQRIDRTIGVIKAYTTRVGEGPFPTELKEGVGEVLAREGNEFGATTGRPRRCGWFDAVVGRYSATVNGCDFWCVTKLDVMDSLDKVRICVAYECDGTIYDTVPANIRVLERCKPVYEEMDGWQSSTQDATSFEGLPQKTQDYVNRLCELTGVQLGMLSVGPKRASTLRVAI